MPPFDGMQAPSEHVIWPDGQLAAHALFAHTEVAPEHIVVQVPQWVASEATQLLPHASRPALHRHWPP